MKPILKWAALVLGGLVALGVFAVGFVYFSAGSRMGRTYEIDPAPMNLAQAPTSNGAQEDGSGNGERASGPRETGNEGLDGTLDTSTNAALAWGKHIAITRGCADCHGGDLGGGVFAEAMPVFNLYGSNLTPGGVGADYSDVDWVRAIRHGIGPDGKPLLFMPSFEYYYLSDQDLASLILYLRSLPAVDRQMPENAVGPMGRILFMTGKLPLLSAELIDHGAPRPVAPPRGATVDYGAYLAKGCIGCHGENLSGGPVPGTPPDWPPALNITQDLDTGIGSWTRDDFFRAMRQGQRPDGTQLRPEFMPWPNVGTLYDDELEALWRYLEQVEARPFGGR